MCAIDNQAVRVLVAEDNYALANVLRFNLQRAGFSVTVANNGQLAMDLLAREAFDLLMTDFQMPGANGEQLCRAVRQDLQLDHLPIVMCSAKGFEVDIEALKRQYGISDFLYKPFSVQTIVHLVRKLLDPKPLCSDV
ncbi:MAG: response regulator [Aureliella sp.]